MEAQSAENKLDRMFDDAHIAKDYYTIYLLSSQKLVRNCGKAIKKAMIFSQILECSKSSEVHSTERNLPLEVELSCNFVKESLNFSNLVFSNLYFLCLWRFSHFFSDNWRTTWKKYFERNNLGTKQLHRT